MPDDVFARVDGAARRLGISRSEFLTRAAQRHLAGLDHAALVEQVNQAYAAEGAEARADERLTTAYSVHRLATESSLEDWG
jgi:metal-responsive CopG/Arc/MetJ family transcriptional regulator